MSQQTELTIESGPVLALGRAAALCRKASRPDLGDRLETAAYRLVRPDTFITVVGEFKQGKSALVNGLLGLDVCPVDDDITTSAVTILTYGATAKAQVSVRNRNGDRTETVAIAQLGDYVTERAPLPPGDFVLSADVHVPSPFLASGITLVDTPGVGGLNPGYLAMTLAYVQLAGACLFVSDASAPLTRAELDFLREARAVCPTVLMVLTKIDLYPEWRTILDLDARSLAANGLEIPVLPVSSAVRGLAFAHARADLNAESHFPELLDAIGTAVLQPSGARQVVRAASDFESCLAQVESSLGTELAALEDPAVAAGELTRLDEARRHLEALRAGGSRWSMVLADGFGDVVANVDHEFRAAIRLLVREVEERIEENDPAAIWDDLTAEIRTRVTAIATQAVTGLEDGAARVGHEIAQLLRDEEVAIEPERPSVSDVDALWLGKTLESPGLAARAGTGYAGLRGAQGGILVFGMVANLAGIALSTFALAGLGLVFGGKQLLDERRRQALARRQQARQLLRQFLDDVQFSVSRDMRDLSRQLQRTTRDHFSGRLAELLRTHTEAAEALQRTARQTEEQRAMRLRAIGELLAESAEIRDSASFRGSV